MFTVHCFLFLFIVVDYMIVIVFLIRTHLPTKVTLFLPFHQMNEQFFFLFAKLPHLDNPSFLVTNRHPSPLRRNSTSLTSLPP